MEDKGSVINRDSSNIDEKSRIKNILVKGIRS